MYQQDLKAFGWSKLSGTLPKGLQEIKANPDVLQKHSTPEKGDNVTWQAIKVATERNRVLSISAKRALAHREESRQFKMGTKIRMLYGYFDMIEGGAFSDIVEIPLDEDINTRARVVPQDVLKAEAAVDAKRRAALAKATAKNSTTTEVNEEEDEEDEDFYDDNNWGDFGDDFE